jgi:hypothetical protein
MAAGAGLLAFFLSAATGERALVQAQTENRAEPAGAAYLVSAQEVIKDWPQLPQMLAMAMLEEYGEPSLMEEDALVWLNNGPWLRTIVYRTAQYHASAAPDKDYLQQIIGYGIPAGKVSDLKLFDKRIEVYPTEGELSSCSDSERSNYLALNLAHEIIRGKKSARDARKFYDRTSRLAAAGKSSPYTEGLLWNPAY